ncbi:hypothetical protein [Flavobacterium caeni]|uniref:Uncharacterized protein n=1 Tax=Flavobacterium caeni TaxID=490189 RepID=A0A1G5IP12_9FLAO|nr:hypothetical protein [Flavobacterium caeni]SCY77480.1 hypothetical protein SAMN02927903_02338 [Flavobacterium caeni]
MNAKSLLGLLSIALVLGACKKDLEPQTASETPTTAAPDAAASNDPVAQMTPTAAPTMTATPGATTVQPTAVAPGMNPAHGQPGHRCDIAVGAPLNSAAKMTSQPAMTINPNQASGNQSFKITPTAAPTGGTPKLLQPPAASAQPVVTAPGMNPPHGQPGHRCDIAVGAPLNSAAAAPKIETAKTETKAAPMEITVSDPAKGEEKKAE